ncbi:MAG: AAA family ATPase [Chloroflexi bacterium]|nr:AAA family ATPase [Chloroflexota bacterium]
MATQKARGENIHPLELPPEKLRNLMDPAALDFDNTQSVEPLVGTTGQARAVDAIDFGLNIKTYGYNLFVAGPTGTGRNTTIRAYVENAAKNGSVPPDWCYVFNFRDPYRPSAISLPPGQGEMLAKDMDGFLETAKREIPRAFESENYEQRKREIQRELDAKREAISNELQQHAREQGFAIEATPIGIVTVPVINGKPLSREEFDSLPEQAKRVIQERSEKIEEEIRNALARSRKLEKDANERIRDLDKEVALFAVGHLLEFLMEKYRAFPKVEDYLAQVQEDMIEHIDDFRAPEKEAVQIPGLDHIKRDSTFDRYKVNVIINNKDARGAPVIVEHNPTYYNLFGRIDYRARLGALFTDFNMIKPGDIHRANGGYLILQARDVLLSLLSWDMLKRTLRSREAHIENIGEQYSPFPSATLRPEPIPIDVKVIIVGQPMIYHLLYDYDDDFRKLFKVRVDFDTEMPRTPENIHNYGAFISARCREAGLKHFDRTGVAKVVEYGSRLLEHQGKLSTRFLDIADIVTEASYWASRDNSAYVSARHVEEAIGHKEYRSNLIEQKVHELIAEGTLLISTEGAVPGQVNGLYILDLGDYYFGRPTRITARTSLGSAGMVNIERETKLSGRIHNKGFLILSSYLSEKFAQEKPLTLSAAVTFEQTYDEIEGDSASSTELYCLLSSLSGVPMRQNLAVTGSVNQRGEIQPVGGVTRKIEGFFDTCVTKGLTGDQGVLIPAANVKNLMLRDDVVNAVTQGKFHIYAVRTVDEGIEILTGLPSGMQKPDGTWEEGTVYYLVDKKLKQYADRAKEFGKLRELRGLLQKETETERAALPVRRRKKDIRSVSRR